MLRDLKFLKFLPDSSSSSSTDLLKPRALCQNSHKLSNFTHQLPDKKYDSKQTIQVLHIKIFGIIIYQSFGIITN